MTIETTSDFAKSHWRSTASTSSPAPRRVNAEDRSLEKDVDPSRLPTHTRNRDRFAGDAVDHLDGEDLFVRGPFVQRWSKAAVQQRLTLLHVSAGRHHHVRAV